MNRIHLWAFAFVSLPATAVLASTNGDAPRRPVAVDTASREGVGPHAPCGRRTLLVVNNDRGDRYVFCTLQGGIAVAEILADGDDRRSLIGATPAPVDLLAQVLPPDAQVPDDVLAAVAGDPGAIGRRGVAAPWVVGVPAVRTAVARSSGGAKAICAAPTRPFNPMEVFFHDSTYCGIVHTQNHTANNSGAFQVTASLQHDAGGNEGSHQHAGPHENFGGGTLYYFADEDEDGGARYGYTRIRVCDGSVRVRGFKKPSPTTGSFESQFDSTVHEGETLGFYMWGNSPHSLWMGYDADDMRFRADAIGQASYGGLVYYAKYGWGPQCDINYSLF